MTLPDYDGQYTDTFGQGRQEEKRQRRRQAPEDVVVGGRLKDRKGNEGKTMNTEDDKRWMQRKEDQSQKSGLQFDY